MDPVSGDLEACIAPTARVFNGPVTLGVSLALRTLSSICIRAPCRVVTALLYTHTQSPALKVSSWSRASLRAEFRPSNPVTVKAYYALIRRRLVAITGQVAVGKLVTIQALVAEAIGTLNVDERQAAKSSHVGFVWS